MKAVFLIFILLAVPGLSFCQSSQEQETKPKSEGPSLPQRQIVDLPRPKQGYRPKLTLQQALTIGEHYVEVEKLDLSSYYLLEAKFILWGGNVKDPRWLFVWLNSGRASKTQGVDFQLTVSMEGKVSIIPSM
ncbi:MAG TPA: hypothetical protein VN476_09600 [Pyrinomonadaceae bacterium]|jgi:hypothetical protein|nr:hypothetical protein [Pyrinomonadaceae bacterium]